MHPMQQKKVLNIPIQNITLLNEKEHGAYNLKI